ncbi:hypothetical protein [Nocardia puris]|uniref:hypothetical protein n=1 Tax=Nocardia puris TaxID=208602 RepID=UPI002E1EA765
MTHPDTPDPSGRHTPHGIEPIAEEAAAAAAREEAMAQLAHDLTAPVSADYTLDAATALVHMERLRAVQGWARAIDAVRTHPVELERFEWSLTSAKLSARADGVPEADIAAAERLGRRGVSWPEQPSHPALGMTEQLLGHVQAMRATAARAEEAARHTRDLLQEAEWHLGPDWLHGHTPETGRTTNQDRLAETLTPAPAPAESIAQAIEAAGPATASAWEPTDRSEPGDTSRTPAVPPTPGIEP